MEKGQKHRGDKCSICNQELATSTAARTSHLRKHVRDGSLEEKKDKSGKLAWYTTGKNPKSKEDNFHYPRFYHSQKHDSRKPVVAKSNKKGNVFLRCKKCNEFKVSSEFADERFVNIVCCNKITIFPKRALDQVLSNPGKEYIE